MSFGHGECEYTKIMMKVALFVPCYVDALFPETGVAAYKLLRYLGVDVTCPSGQTCCGQPMANAGFENMSKPLVEGFEKKFRNYDYVVIPSVSCAAFVRFNYPKILPQDHACVTPKTAMDIVEFLHDVLHVQSLPGKFPHVVSVHNSCHGVRELSLSSPSELHTPAFNKIIDLLNLVQGITVKQPDRPDECCGFGGMFAVEEPDVSARMGSDKLSRHIATGAEYVTGPDSSCLMHLSGIARRQHRNIKFIHVVEILAAGL